MAEEIISNPNPVSGTTIETQKMTTEDTEKAKKKGSLFGDPIVIIE
jgi:hypothetical protein